MKQEQGMFGQYRSGPDFAPERRAVYGCFAAVVFLAFLLYIKTTTFDFLNWDDNHYVATNGYLKKNIFWFLKHAFLEEYFVNWHPITTLSYKLDYMLWGLKPAGFHLTNVVLHSLTSGFVFIFAHRLFLLIFRGEGDMARRLAAAGFCAALFAVHPLHVESVAWISERKDQLSAIFFVLSLTYYLEYGRGEMEAQRRFYLISLGFFVLALMSKPMAVTLPLVLLILDFYPLGRINDVRSFLAQTVKKAPFLFFGCAAAAVTLLIQAKGIVSSEYLSEEVRTASVVQSYWFYLEKTFYPEPLLPFYSYDDLANWRMLAPQTVSALFALSGITVLCIVYVRKRPYMLAALAYYFVTLLPVIGIVKVGGQSAADRYMYIPSIGLFLLGGGVVAAALGCGAGRRTKVVVMMVAISIVAVLAVKAFLQIDIWRDSYSLWTHQIKYEKSKKVALLVYMKRGNYFYKKGQNDKAVEDYTAGLELGEGRSGDYVVRGDAFMRLGAFGKAEADYKKALALDMGMHVEPYRRLEMLYVELGKEKKAAYYGTFAEKIVRGERIPFVNVEEAAAPEKLSASER